MTDLTAFPPRPLRIRAALRSAINLRVKQGLTIAAACKQSGMSPQGYHKAMKRPAVRDYLQTIQFEFVASVESDRAIYTARAMEVGMDLMLHSKSEAVRARMVEFFASDGKAPQVSVHFGTQQTGGYEYVRPSRQVVEIGRGKSDAQHVLEPDVVAE